MDYIEVKLKRGTIKCPVVIEGVFTCPVSFDCKDKYCKVKGGKDTPTLDTTIKNGNLIIYCFTGGTV